MLAEFHKIYSVSDDRIVGEISKLSPNDPVSGMLRDLCWSQKGAFKMQLSEVVLSFPDGPKFGNGEAAVCSGSDLYTRKIHIYDPQQKHSVTLQVNGVHPCPSNRPGASEGKEWIQITHKTGRKLLGRRPKGFESGLAGIATN